MENKTLKPQTFKKGIKAIFIEPHLGKISEIELTGGFPALYEIIGCDLVETCRSIWQSGGKNEMMYFDENGRHKKLQFGFQHKLINVDKFNLPFMGNCVTDDLCSCDVYQVWQMRQPIVSHRRIGRSLPHVVSGSLR